MRSDQYLVTSSIGGVKRSQPWDPADPLVLDAGKTLVLENSGGYMIIKDVGRRRARSGLFKARKPVEELVLGKKKEYFPDQSGELNALIIHTDRVEVEIKRLRPIPGAFRTSEEAPTRAKSGHFLQFIVFSGEGGLLRESQHVRSAYVAYSRENPVFTVHFGDDFCEVKPLFQGVKLKLKGQKSDRGELGESWRLSTEDLLSATVFRGSRWWRFRRIEVSELLDQSDSVELDEFESQKINRTLVWFGLGFLLVALMIYLAPTQQKVIEPEKLPPPVRVKIAHPKPKVAAVVRAAPVVQAAPAAPAPKPIEKPPAPAAKAPVKEPPRAAPAVSLPGPPKSGPSGVKAQQAAHAAAASARLGALRSAFKEALSLTHKSSNAPAVSAPGAREMFKGGKTSLIPTQINPGYTASGVQVGSLGSTVGDSSDLVEADRNKSVGGGPSFAAVGTGVPSVQEGLTKEEVGRVIHQHMDEVRACHESAMLFKPNLQGKLQVKFMINRDGIVTSAQEEESTLPDTYLSDCILKKIPRWRFPKPKNGVNVSVSYPFIFKTLRRD